MGHSTCGSHGKRTCDRCDKCPDCYNFRLTRHVCPVGYCPTFYVCPACWAEVKGKIKHDSCRVSSAQYHESLRLRAVAESEGRAVIRAGVSLPSGRVFAWTAKGNFEVTPDAYELGLTDPAHVLDLTGASLRHEERPPEVYGR